MNQNNLQQVDVGVKICDHQHQLVALQAPQPPQAPQQQQVHNMRQNRRMVNDAIKDQRHQRRNSMSNLGGAPKNPAPTKYKEVAATVLSNDEPNNISILREERRKVRVQKRLDRELRRTKEGQNNLSQQPSEAQIRREALRLAREKKRLAREEERDVAAGVKPVTEQDLQQIIQQQEEKKKVQVQQTMTPEITHQVVKNGNGVHVNIKLRLYD